MFQTSSPQRRLRSQGPGGSTPRFGDREYAKKAESRTDLNDNRRGSIAIGIELSCSLLVRRVTADYRRRIKRLRWREIPKDAQPRVLHVVTPVDENGMPQRGFHAMIIRLSALLLSPRLVHTIVRAETSLNGVHIFWRERLEEGRESKCMVLPREEREERSWMCRQITCFLWFWLANW